MKQIYFLIFFWALLFSATSAIAQTEEIFYRPKLLQTDLADAKMNLERVLKLMSTFKYEDILSGRPDIITVFDDRFELKYKKPKYQIVFYFYDIIPNNYEPVF